MEIKTGLEISTQDFWYDLTDGGYLKPERICESATVAVKVNKAIDLLMDFQQSCETQIEGFIQ